MTTQATQFTGSIPEYYDRGLGPRLFAPYAHDIAGRIAALSPQSVLELAAGTGIVTRHLRNILPDGTALTATDLNPPMLAVARAKFRAGEPVAFETADATALPFADAAFDAVLCQFGVMFFPDKDRSHREVARVLRPGGTYVFNVWDRMAVNPFARIAMETIGGFFESDPPAFYKTPFGYFEINPIKASLQAAGFGRITAEIVRFDQDVGDMREFAEGLVLGNPVVEEISARSSAKTDDVIVAVAEALQREFGARARMPLQAIVFEARKV